ncbi:MAG: TraB/GumN family protein [Caulobacteraceae bacterium]
MIRPIIDRLLLAAALALLAGPAMAKPPVWVVHGRGATVTLFGSVHLLPPGLDWRPPALDEALAKADELWFELPIDEAVGAQAARLGDRLGALPARDTLSAHLDTAQKQRLDRIAGALGVSLALLERIKPWEAEVVLSLADDARSGAVASEGVEQVVQRTTPPGVRRRAFETARQQIGFLAGASMAAQVASLDETLAEIEAQPDLYDRIVRAWLAGDLKTLDDEALAPLRRQSPAMYQRLILARNRHWAKVIARVLKGRADAVVIVGMDHLLGVDGLPALLRERGYVVDGPQSAP